jgi:hypothetical protein
MIASITFTYGDNRTEVYRYKSKDTLDKIFRNSFDFNLYVFHNSSESFVKEIRESKLLSDFKFTFARVGGPWPKAFRQALQILKQKGVERMVFMEDDVFTTTENKDLVVELATFLKTTDLHYLNLEYNTSNFPNHISTRNAIIKKTNFNVYNTDTHFFKSISPETWAFDHSPYYCNLDFAMREFYPPIIEQYTDIWSIEWMLKHKYEQTNMPRYITDQQLFRRVNLLGRHPNTDIERKYLNDKFPIE